MLIPDRGVVAAHTLIIRGRDGAKGRKPRVRFGPLISLRVALCPRSPAHLQRLSQVIEALIQANGQMARLSRQTFADISQH
jgi:hypothetical protein